MLLRLILIGLVLSLVTACKPEWPKEDPVGGKPETLMPCDVGPSGRFVVSADSVGPFAVATAVMDDVVSSCGSASTAWEPTSGGFAVLARLDYPGVHLAARQEAKDTVARPLSRVVGWEVAGDSVYIAGFGLMPATVADLSRMFGRGWAENPDHRDNDGPRAIVCALPNIAFRIMVPRSQPARKWPVDTSAVNRDTRVIAMTVVPEQSKDCRES